MSSLTAGVFGNSNKDHEMRVPIHPGQMEWIDPVLRSRVVFEEGYGDHFLVSDEEIRSYGYKVASREKLYRECDILLMPKPVIKDFRSMREGTIHWGWPHCVQQQAITQLAIDKRLTLIAWEAMHRWSSHGEWKMHIFHRNNELAGYAGILHALGQAGIDGNYGPARKAIIIGFGSVSRGAIRALQALGIQQISVFTQRYAILVASQMAGVDYFHFEKGKDGKLISLHPDRHSYPFIEELADADIIVNGTLQDTDDPLMFVEEGQLDRLKKGCLIADISCDEGMGFYFARPTSFYDPIFRIGPVDYYAVDHTPSYLWRSASWEISRSVLPYLPLVMDGPDRWDGSETLRRAIEIREGVIQNPRILSFQNRAGDYPHEVVGS